MTKRMLIDAAHAEETRVVVVDGSRIEELDVETQSHKQLRGNIYLAKVTRVEPSLQAAFVEYGGNRHGFLAFNEIHPDYYQIPVADREALMREDLDDEDDHVETDAVDENGEAREPDEDDVMEAEVERRRRRLMRRYKIQEVIKRRQIMLVQVVKEERGNKGAALTSYLSLAGRYCVLMPNTARGGGISRKITNAADRKRLKSAAVSLDVPQGMGLIIRTAGAARTKAEIQRDYEYLLRLWETIREQTLRSIAPALIYEEEDLVKRAIRDMYDKDVEGVLVQGEAGFREAQEFMRMIMPSQANKIVHYDDPVPLFVRHKIETQLAQVHSPTVQLRSGGYLVINQTEALVAIDVNSGRATRERNIEATAFKTNLEAAEEAARQLRLRDLAGLIVIDFIDMDEGKNNRAVEKKLKDCLKDDRARVQMGKISPFGLMEISRQRRRVGVLEGSTDTCPHCQGAGRLRSVESGALAALRALEVEAARAGPGAVIVRLPLEVALYILNDKRTFLARLEETHGLKVAVMIDDKLARAEHALERTAGEDGYRDLTQEGPPALIPGLPAPGEEWEDDEEIEDEAAADDAEDSDETDAETGGGEDREERGGRRRRRRRGRRDESRVETVDGDSDSEEDDEDEETASASGEAGGGESDEESRRRRRRRGRRGGRRFREEAGSQDVYGWTHAHAGAEPLAEAEDPYAWRDPLSVRAAAPAASEPQRAEAAPAPTLRDSGAEESAGGREGGRRRRGRGRGRGGRDRDVAPVGAQDAAEAPAVANDPYAWTDAPAEVEESFAIAAPAEPVPDPEPLPDIAAVEPPKRRRVKRTAEAAPDAVAPDMAAADAAAPTTDAPEAAPPARRTRSRRKPAAEAAAAVETPAEEAAQQPVGELAVEPPPEPEAAAPEPAQAPEPAAPVAVAPPPPPAPKPDPAEISAPPAAPRRGWWRRG